MGLDEPPQIQGKRVFRVFYLTCSCAAALELFIVQEMGMHIATAVRLHAYMSPVESGMHLRLVGTAPHPHLFLSLSSSQGRREAHISRRTIFGF
jgi:hypothetical protein